MNSRFYTSSIVFYKKYFSYYTFAYYWPVCIVDSGYYKKSPSLGD